MKQEKWISETTEVMLVIKLPLTREKRPFSRSLCLFLFILTVTGNFLLLAGKWPKFLVLAVMPTPHLGPFSF